MARRYTEKIARSFRALYSASLYWLELCESRAELSILVAPSDPTEVCKYILPHLQPRTIPPESAT